MVSNYSSGFLPSRCCESFPIELFYLSNLLFMICQVSYFSRFLLLLLPWPRSWERKTTDKIGLGEVRIIYQWCIIININLSTSSAIGYNLRRTHENDLLWLAETNLRSPIAQGVDLLIKYCLFIAHPRITSPVIPTIVNHDFKLTFFIWLPTSKWNICLGSECSRQFPRNGS